MPELTDKDELRELFDSASKIDEANYQHYQDHFEELQRNYAGEIVVILDEQVVASREFTSDLSELRSFINDLKEEYSEDTVKKAYITHITDPEQVMIF